MVVGQQTIIGYSAKKADPYFKWVWEEGLHSGSPRCS